MKLGVLLPTFRSQLTDALALAENCCERGIDGVFAYDHLFPMRDPSRGAFAPLPVLARVATLFPSLWVGPLVARVGMVATSTLVGQFETLAAIAPGRIIAGIGTGDSWSNDELIAYGLPLLPADERRALVRATAEALAPQMPVWVGGGSPATQAVARAVGAEVNLWNPSPEAIAQSVAHGPTNVAGDPAPDLGGQLDALDVAGVTWAIFTPGVDLEKVSSWRGQKTL